MTGQTEILIIAGVVILLFGATALPKLARSLGKARKEFKEGLKEGAETDIDKHEEEKPSEQDS